MFFSTSSDHKQKYEEIPTHEHEPLPANKDSRPRRDIVRSILIPLTYLLLGLAVGLTIGIYAPALSTTSCLIRPASPIPHDVLTAKIPVRFVPDKRYVGPSEEVNRNWMDLIKGSDAIYLKNPEIYGLGKGMEAPPELSRPKDVSLVPSENFYVVSNLRQLHCLNIIRSRYWHLLLKEHSPSDRDADEWLTNVDQCLEYLRLGIKCGDLLAIEPDSPPDTPTELAVEGLGWGVTHYCLDYDRLLEYQEQQERAWNRTWQEDL